MPACVATSMPPRSTSRRISRGRTLKDGEKFIGKAPAALVDLKAAVRYLKVNDKFMPGDANKIISPVGEFRFEIDQDWKHKLLNGLDDIGITLQYEDLIAAYEKNRPAYWQ